MSKPFDATLKDLSADFPRDFPTTLAGPTALPIKVLNVDLSTVTTAADFVVAVGEPAGEIYHVDFQSGPDEGKHADVLVYNSLLFRLRRVPIHSILVLLRPQAAHANVNGSVSYARAAGSCRMNFGYEVVKIWERPAEELLQGGLGTTPLAMLGKLPEGVELEEALRGVAQRLVERLQAEGPPPQTERLVTAAWLLTGLRVARTIARKVFTGVRAMRDSDTFMAIIDEGRELQTRKLLVRVAEKHLGPPDEETRTRLEGIVDVERLERIHDRAAVARSWDDLLDTP